MNLFLGLSAQSGSVTVLHSYCIAWKSKEKLWKKPKKRREGIKAAMYSLSSACCDIMYLSSVVTLCNTIPSTVTMKRRLRPVAGKRH